MTNENESQADNKKKLDELSVANFGDIEGVAVLTPKRPPLFPHVSDERIVEIADLRKRLKKAGFNVKTRTLSLGIHAYLTDDNGIEMRSIFTEETMKKWAPVLKIMREEYAGCDFRVNGQKTFGLKSQCKNA